MVWYLINGYFQNILFNVQITLLTLICIVVSLLAGLEIQFEDEMAKNGGFGPLRVVGAVMIFILMTYMIANRLKNPERLTEIIKGRTEQSKFKLIFDNLEEPIIIANRGKVEYCNHAFMLKFEKLIRENLVPVEDQVEKKKKRRSCIDFFNWLAKTLRLCVRLLSTAR